MIKYDFLTTSALTKIRLTMDMLVENEHIEKKPTLKETYYSVLDPHRIKYDKPETWGLIADNKVMDLFQFDSLVAMQTVNEIQPKSLVELAQANSLMRLQPQEGAIETPTETYIRYKNNIKEWYMDMDKVGVPKKDQEIIKEILLPFNGVADTQESIMALSRAEKLTGFSVGEAHKLRSVIGKKKTEQIPQVRKKFYDMGKQNNVCKNTLDYLWNYQFMLQLNYSFSILHTMAYTFIALQELILYSQFPSIYWNTAVLTVNSGSVEDDEITTIDEFENGFNEDKKEKNKNKATKYGKIAKAIGDLQNRGVTVTLPLINEAGFSFTPDEHNNRIIFGLKGINGIGDDVANTIINLRPYKNFEDFYNKVTNIDEDDTTNVKIGDAKIISLIKAGCFDELEKRPREDLMKDFIKTIIEPRQQLDMRSIKTILDFNIIPEKFDKQIRIINFRNYVLKQSNFVKKDNKYKSKKIYKLQGETDFLTNVTHDFFFENYGNLMIEDKHYWYNIDGDIEFYDTDLKRATDTLIEDVKGWINTKEALDLYNNKLFNQKWDKDCQGSISKWEMDSVSFYCHDHELCNVNFNKYNISDFYKLPEEPQVVGQYKWRGRIWDEYAIYRIAGTVLDRDRTKHTVSLLTPTGVVTIKMYAGSFNHYNKQIAKTVIEKGKEKKQVVEPSWFTRGNLISVVGFRRGGVFIPKKYKNTVYRHTIQKITGITNNGDLTLQSERKKGDM